MDTTYVDYEYVEQEIKQEIEVKEINITEDEVKIEILSEDAKKIKSEEYCIMCQEFGHVISSVCVTCFNCGIKGHPQKDCPHNQVSKLSIQTDMDTQDGSYLWNKDEGKYDYKNPNKSKADRAEIVRECTEDLISPRDLAKKWNCNPDTIRTWVRKAGKALPKRYKKSINRDILRLNIQGVETVQDDKKISEDKKVSDDMSDAWNGEENYNTQDVSYLWIKEESIVEGRYDYKNPEKSEADRAEIVREYTEDFISYSDLAKKWNCNREAVRLWVRQAHALKSVTTRTCLACKKIFKRPSDRIQHDAAKHKAQQSNLKPMTCIPCNRHFDSQDLLHQHNDDIHPSFKFICLQCNRLFLTQARLEQHNADKHPTSQIQQQDSLDKHTANAYDPNYGEGPNFKSKEFIETSDDSDSD